MSEVIIVPDAKQLTVDQPHDYFESQGLTHYLILLTPRLRDLISALEEAPREQHNEIKGNLNG